MYMVSKNTGDIDVLDQFVTFWFCLDFRQKKNKMLLKKF